ncbi:DUF4190 domain-containing protein [Streptomyces sp. NBC_01754]|uniref:DUF4190 domain-containing protein n=1 Tax=Streptomyces sp. NBC_01754 TaxID=2975930 RepID=UPI002DDACE6B|nr:DUF4190 domain-containing protein [Streptomyces sp. NBC_01754]WSC95137.1 DUF4190 domain-containing protein [Streptomyces sp. NBC_01754]
MSDHTPRPGDGPAPHDPWAPPENRVDLGKTVGDARPPGVHDQPTVTSMPSTDAGTGPVPGPPAGGFGPGQGGGLPPPPVAPHGPALPGAQYGYPVGPSAPYTGYPGYPGYPGHAGYGGGPAPANGLGVAALVLGIVATAGFCFWGLGVVLGVLALVFGIIGQGRAKRGEATNGGMALAGIILGAIAIPISAVCLAFLIWLGHQDDVHTEESGDGYAATLVVDAPLRP